MPGWFLRFRGEPDLPLGAGGESAVLSPHPDDAAFSLGGLLQRDLIPRPITLITVFGRSNYCTDTGFATDWRTNTERRRREDQAFARALGLELCYLELPEASLRPGRAERPLFTNPRGLVPSPGLREALDRELAARPFRFVWIPLGLGGHRDHLLTERAATTLARDRGLTRLYYEDLPYAGWLSERAIRRRAAAVDGGLRWTEVEIGGVLEAKLEALGGYASQIRDKHLRAVREHHSRRDPARPVERVWWAP